MQSLVYLAQTPFDLCSFSEHSEHNQIQVENVSFCRSKKDLIYGSSIFVQTIAFEWRKINTFRTYIDGTHIKKSVWQKMI